VGLQIECGRIAFSYLACGSGQTTLIEELTKTSSSLRAVSRMSIFDGRYGWSREKFQISPDSIRVVLREARSFH